MDFESLQLGRGTLERREPRSSMLLTNKQGRVRVRSALKLGAMRLSVRPHSNVDSTRLKHALVSAMEVSEPRSYSSMGVRA